MTTTPPGAGLGAMIRTWRNRLPPSAAGLPVVRKRRAVGLRREELADLAGVSVDYVVRLEQGRATTPSASVVASLARALQLSTAERDHLYRLAQIVPPHGRHDLRPPPARYATSARPPRRRTGCRVRGGLATGVVEPRVGRPAGRPLGLAAADAQLRPRQVPGGRRSHPLALWPVTETDPDTADAALVSDLRRATGRFPGTVAWPRWSAT